MRGSGLGDRGGLRRAMICAVRARAAEHSRGARGSNPTAPARPTLSFDPPEHAEGAARSGGAIYFTSKLDLSSPLGRAAADEKSGPRVDFGRTPLDAGGQRPTRARAVRRGGAWSASGARRGHLDREPEPALGALKS